MKNSHLESPWETEIYGKGKQFNRYPYDSVVSHILRAKANSTKPLSVLEIGCGAANNVVFMASVGVHAHGIDISPSAINFGNSQLKEQNLIADLRVGNFTTLPWSDNRFDLVIDRCALTCNSRDDIQMTLKEVWRVLKPEGEFTGQFYASEHPHKEHGEKQPDGSYKGFTEGHFANMGTMYFARQGDVESLLSKENFSFDYQYHCTKDKHGKILYALWSYSAFKRSVG